MISSMPAKPVFGKATRFSPKIRKAILGRWLLIGYVDGSAEWVLPVSDLDADTVQIFRPSARTTAHGIQLGHLDSPEQIIKAGPIAKPSKDRFPAPPAYGP